MILLGLGLVLVTVRVNGRKVLHFDRMLQKEIRRRVRKAEWQALIARWKGKMHVSSRSMAGSTSLDRSDSTSLEADIGVTPLVMLAGAGLVLGSHFVRETGLDGCLDGLFKIIMAAWAIWFVVSLIGSIGFWPFAMLVVIIIVCVSSIVVADLLFDTFVRYPLSGEVRVDGVSLVITICLKGVTVVFPKRLYARSNGQIQVETFPNTTIERFTVRVSPHGDKIMYAQPGLYSHKVELFEKHSGALLAVFRLTTEVVELWSISRKQAVWGGCLSIFCGLLVFGLKFW